MTISRFLSLPLLALLLTTTAPAARAADVSADYVNILEGRISALEEQMRGVIAQVEQTAYQARTTAEKLDRLQTDIDTRFRMLQDTAAAGASSPTAAPSGAPAAAPTPPRSARDMMNDLESGNAATAPADTDQKTLGELVDEANNDGAATKNPATDANTAYDNAFSLVRDGDYEAAAQAMRSFLKKWPKHDLASNAAYWLGETFYVRGDYANAAKNFAEGYQKYPKGSKSEDVLLKLGMSLAALGRTKDACLSFEQLKSEFPKMSAATQDRVKKEQTSLGCATDEAAPAAAQPAKKKR